MISKTYSMLRYADLQLLKEKRCSFVLNEHITFDFIDYYFRNISIIPFEKIIYKKSGMFFIIKLLK